MPALVALATVSALSSQPTTLGAAGEQRARARQPGAAEAEDGDLLSGEGGDGDHQRSFNVDSPASASTTEMIQKRITICGSVQPICSKW